MKKKFDLWVHQSPTLKKLIMELKITILIIMAGISNAIATPGYSQVTKVSLDMKNTTLETVMDEIESQSEFYFIFNQKQIDINRVVDVQAENKLITDILPELFDGTNVSYAVLERKILLTTDAIDYKGVMRYNELQQEITGTVSDSQTGEPMPGVNVLVKGSILGTITDVRGRYSITATDKNITLVFSFIGYVTQEIPLTGRNQMDIKMAQEAVGLDEVVVVGYTSKRLAEISSSVTVVSEKKLKDVTSDNLSNLLQGKAPGVVVSSSTGDPTASQSIIIRGSSSITADSDPLYVVDGIIGGTASPQDIESITILKDAAATGLYGSRASNGVIIITTKRGKAGQTRINLNSTVGFNTVDEGKYKVMNSQQLYDFQKTFWDPATFDRDRPASLLSQDTDWHDLMFKTGLTQNHVISVTGGSEKTQIYASGNYYYEEGTLGPNFNESFNLRSNVIHDLTNKLKLSVKMNARIRNTEQEAAGSNFLTSHENMPWDNPYNPDGTLKVGIEPEWIGRDNDNFLHGWQYNFDISKQYSFSGDITLDYKITDRLTFSSNNRYSYSSSKGELYYDVRAKAGGNEGRITNSFSNSNHFITSNRLLYSQTFGKHNISSIAVAEAEKNYSDFVSLYGTGLAVGLHIIDVASVIASASSSTGENIFNKGLVQVDYNFDSRYFIVGSLIRESSSRFGANKRAANFYTLGTSWMINNESFMENLAMVNLLKLRASYGLVGNAQIGNYQTLGLYSYAAQYAGNPGSYPSQLANKDLTWEKAEIINLGLDVGLFKRVTVNAEIYQKLTRALLLDVEIPFTTGFSSVMQNVGSVRNRGLELNLNTINLNKQLRWETNFNIAFNKNKVLALDNGKDILQGGTGASPGSIIRVGEDLNSWYLRKWAGVDPANGDPLWEVVTIVNDEEVVTTTNQYSSATLQIVGNYTPKFTGGFTNVLAYKGLSLSAFFNFVGSVMVYNYSEFVVNSDGTYPDENQLVLAPGESRWKNTGDIATHPRPVFGGSLNSNRASSRYLHDGSYIRMRNVKLTYELPKSVLARLGIGETSIYISGDNLWTGTSFTGKDPQANFERGGGQVANYPISRKVMFGINIEL